MKPKYRGIDQPRQHARTKEYSNGERGIEVIFARHYFQKPSTYKRWIQQERLRLSRRFSRLNPGERLDGWVFQSCCAGLQMKPVLGGGAFFDPISYP